MTEWHVPFDRIEEQWTEGQFRLMLDRLIERKKAEADAAKKSSRRKGRGEPVPYLEAG